jgi:hypothetical protein
LPDDVRYVNQSFTPIWALGDLLLPGYLQSHQRPLQA